MTNTANIPSPCGNCGGVKGGTIQSSVGPLLMRKLAPCECPEETTDCPDCGEEYVEFGRTLVCECNYEECRMEREHMEEGREMNRAMAGDWS